MVILMELFAISTAVGNGDGSDLSMEIVQNNQVVYKLAFDDPGKNGVKSKGDSLKVTLDEQKKVTIVGDTKFRFHSSNGVRNFFFSQNSCITDYNIEKSQVSL